MARHLLRKHRHQWSPWSVVYRSFAGHDPKPVRYDDGTVLWRRSCTVEQCPRVRERCWWPGRFDHGRRRLR
jgi:hypothetical protein